MAGENLKLRYYFKRELIERDEERRSHHSKVLFCFRS